MTENKKVCPYCGNEIGKVTTNNDGSSICNMHINKRGSMEKCYTERKNRFLRWLLGKENYRGVKAWYQTGSIKITPLTIDGFKGISINKEGSEDVRT